MQLWIAEKPSMARDIANALGGNVERKDGFLKVNNNVVTWAIGHLLVQATFEAYDPKYTSWDVDLLPFFPKKWLMVPNQQTKDQLSIVGKLIKQADTVINCGDAAREGQLIVDELIDYFGYRGPVKRLWLQAMNNASIQNAMKKMCDNNAMRGLYESALSRSRADYYIGMNLTRSYTHAWKSKGYGETVHIGRVQTPLLCMLVARDLEIESFVPSNYYVLLADVKHENGSFKAAWVPNSENVLLNDDGHVTDKKIVDKLAKDLENQSADISVYRTKSEKNNSPLPFSLGELQKTCFKLFGLSPADTLVIAQSLYEKHKLISYPRTDYSHFPEDEFHLAKKIAECAKSNFGAAWDLEADYDYSIKSAAWDSAKVGDHHGLRPTEARNYDLSLLSNIEFKVYRLIVRNYMAQFLQPYRYDSTVVEVICKGQRFKATGSVPIDIGWKIIFKTNTETETEEAEAVLPTMKVGDKCTLAVVLCDARKTKPPARFNSATLLDAMENAHKYVVRKEIKDVIAECGMGTTATRAKMIKNMLDREYAEEIKEGRIKVFVSTQRGRMLYYAAPNEMKTPDITAYFESLLKSVEKGDLAMQDFLNHQEKFVTKLVDDVKSGVVAANMPDINSIAPRKIKGKSNSEKKSDNKSNGNAKPAQKKSGNSVNKKCPDCAADMVLRSQGKFWGCTNYPKCRHTENTTKKQ